MFSSNLSLYIHIPWCVRKCPYCDFNSHQQKNELPEDAYVQRLLDDLDNDLASFSIKDRNISSIFFGGGTPSLFSAMAIEKILEGVNTRLTLTNDCEITLEANPGTFEADKFSGFRKAGINRLSIGIQSFADEQLKKLGRIHNSGEAKRAIQTAFDSGFDNLNIDLMYALSQQSIDEALHDLETAFSFPITHLSHYQLTLEPNTLFAKYPPKLPNDDAIWDMQQACQNFIAENGFNQYEVSAYAKCSELDLRAQHNLNYWRFNDYLGIGAGAHGKLSLADGQIVRTMKPKHPKQYLDHELNHTFQNQSIIKTKDRAFEFFLNRLRLHEHFTKLDFQQTTGLEFSEAEPHILLAQTNQWLIEESLGFKVTKLGQQFLNNLQEIFLPD